MTRLVYCPGVCRECGCTTLDACEDEETGETCGWAEDDLCTFCAYEMSAPDYSGSPFTGGDGSAA